MARSVRSALYRNHNSSDSDYIIYSVSLNDVVLFPTFDETEWSVPTGKKFKEWNSARDGSGTAYHPGDDLPNVPPEIPAEVAEYAFYAIYQDPPEDISTITLPNGTTYAFKDETARDLAEGAIQAPDSATAGDSLIFDGTDWSAGDTTFRSSSIPFGKVDSTSTSTVFTATVPGITDLHDGVNVFLMNGVVTSAANFTININNLGAKPVYSTLAAATRATTLFNVNYTLWLVYNSHRVSGGCWDAYYGYDSNTNTVGYQLRTNSLSFPMSDYVGRYRIMFTSADGAHFVPSTTSTSTNATASRDVCQTPIDPFGRIVYYSSTTAVSAGSRPGAGSLWQQYAITFGYSFNRTGAALTLTSWKPIYIKCAPQSNGSAIIDSETPYVQDLPETADGKIYILLGVAYSATAVELTLEHPVYEYKNGRVQQYTNHKYTASDVGAIPAPASPSSGDHLVYNGSAWTAQAASDENDYVWKLGTPTEIVSSQSVSFELDSALNLYKHSGNLTGLTYTLSDINDYVYDVTFDETTYRVLMWELVEENPNDTQYMQHYTFLGDTGIISYRDPFNVTAPFLFEHYTQPSDGVVILTSSTSASHTISVTRYPVIYNAIYRDIQPMFSTDSNDSIISRTAKSAGVSGIAMGAASVAGQQGISLGQNAQSGRLGIAIGSNVKATNYYSTAIGYTSEATGAGATAIGAAKASGQFAVSLGVGEATATRSVAMSLSTAASAHQTTTGKWNVVDSSDTYAFIIGDGTADNARHNLFTIGWNGTVVSNGNTLATTNDIPDASDATPSALGTAAAGSSANYSRADHVHAKPTASQIGAIAAPLEASNGQVLTFNGTSWSAQTPQTGGIPVPSSPIEGHVLTYNGTAWTGKLPNYERISATHAASSAAWAGVSVDKELYDGKQIEFRLAYDSGLASGAKTLKLTFTGSNIQTVTEDIPVWLGGAQVTNEYSAMDVIHMTYNADLNRWECDATGRVPIAYCATAANTGTKTATCGGYTLLANSYVLVAMKSANTRSSSVTLNISGTGAKSIKLNGNNIASGNYSIPAGIYLVYYDGTYYHFRTDGRIPGPTGDAAANAIPAPASPTNGQHLVYNGSAWAAQTVSIPSTASDVGAVAEPSTAGTSGQVLSLDSNLAPVWTTPTAGTVTDVKVNNTSVTSSGVANIPVASTSDFGVIKFGSSNASIAKASDGYPYVVKATDAEVKAGTNSYKPIVPGIQHASTFYGLAEAAGDTTQASSSNAVGTYTDTAKTKIKTMLGVPTTAAGIGAVPDTTYSTFSGVPYYDSSNDSWTTAHLNEIAQLELNPLLVEDGNTIVYNASEGLWMPDHILPPVTSSDNGKVLMVVDGYWQAVTPSGSSLPSANGVSF